MTQQNLTKLFGLRVFAFLSKNKTLAFPPCSLFISVSDNFSFAKAAEQAKASPALVAKDPSASTNKKEEEDLAKGKEFVSMWLDVLHRLNRSKILQLLAH